MKTLLAWTAAGLLAAAAGCSGHAPVLPGAPEGLGAVDPLGIRLDLVGVLGGDAPCDDEHVASVVDEQGRYTAFCRSALGHVSYLHVARADQELVAFEGRTPLQVYLALTPDDVAVPQALLGEHLRMPGRAIVPGSTAYVAPGSISERPVVVEDLDDVNACVDRSFFEQEYCVHVTDEAERADSNAIARCHSGRRSFLRRTGSVQQGEPVPAQEARIVVAACGTRPTRLYRLAKSGFSGDWGEPAVLAIVPGHVVYRTMSTADFDEVRPDGSAVQASDLRFHVEAGPWRAWFRAATAFGEPRG